jgi:hypothetical protein
VSPAFRVNAGEGDLQGKVTASEDDIPLGESREGHVDPDGKIQSPGKGALHLPEKFRLGVRKGIVLKGSECQGWDLVKGAEDGALGEEEDISTGEVDGFIFSVIIRDFFAVDAPMRAIKVPGGEVKNF